jgi:hypothetical protein
VDRMTPWEMMVIYPRLRHGGIEVITPEGTKILKAETVNTQGVIACRDLTNDEPRTVAAERKVEP